jgi:hypothetical protein
MADQPDKVYVSLLAPNLKRDVVVAILDSLEADPLLSPTHASGDERKRIPYARPTAGEGIAAGFLTLWRTKAPAYSGWLSAKSSVTDALVLEFDPAPELATLAGVFESVSRLAEVARPELGLVHLYFQKNVDAAYNRGAASINGPHLGRVGPVNLHARTWLGPYLVKMLTKDLLLTLPFSRGTPWGGVQVDLAPEPWCSDLETLRTCQEAAMNRLNATGMVGVAEGPPVLWKPGPRWVPPDWAPTRRR